MAQVVYVARKSESNGVANYNHDRYFVHPAGQVYRSYQEAIKGVSEKSLAALEAWPARPLPCSPLCE